jgi:hypothetical protein
MLTVQSNMMEAKQEMMDDAVDGMAEADDEEERCVGRCLGVRASVCCTALLACVFARALLNHFSSFSLSPSLSLSLSLSISLTHVQRECVQSGHGRARFDAR